MALFPGALPVAGSASASDTLAAAGHTALHNTSYDEIRALATKLGTGASTATANTLLRGSGSGTSSWGQAVLTTDVTGTLLVANGGTGATTHASGEYLKGAGTGAVTSESLASLSQAVGNLLMPIGFIYTTITSTNPGTAIGFGTWTAFGAGKVLVGLDSGDADFDTVEETGGAKTHTLTTAEMPSHNHTYDGDTVSYSSGTALSMNFGQGAASHEGYATGINNTGGGGAHNNLQPYIVVYMWKRTA